MNPEHRPAVRSALGDRVGRPSTRAGHDSRGIPAAKGIGQPEKSVQWLWGSTHAEELFRITGGSAPCIPCGVDGVSPDRCEGVAT